MPFIAANIAEELCTSERQWVIWRSVQRTDKAKPAKVPYTTMGYRADVTNPEHWSTFEFATKAAARPGFADGIGFVFTADDPYCGIDIDDVWQSDADEGAPWALKILERFADTYSEMSPSGQGVKLWCRAKASRCGNWPVEGGAIEIYDHSRFFAVTGCSAGVRVITDHQADIEALIANLDEGRDQVQQRAIPNVIRQGHRHNTLVSLAGTMWRRGMSSEAIEAALLVTDQKQCAPPYGPANIRRILESIRRWQR
jgi:primase-polymerase (primpol)-like protein